MFTVDKENMPTISTQQMVLTYTSLLAFQEAINENAIAIPSWQCLDLGHFALTISPIDFTTANDNIAFVIPIQTTDPTSQSVAIPVVAGPAPAPLDHFTVLENQRLYIAQKEAFYTYKVTEKALHSLILNSVDNQYINHLKDSKTKYSKGAPRTILVSLWKHYRKVEVSDH